MGRGFIKTHLTVDVNTKQILSIEVSREDVQDVKGALVIIIAEVAKVMSGQLKRKLQTHR